MKTKIYAMGDIHGRVDLLQQLHEHIKEHHNLMYAKWDAHIVYVGDYIDGGANSVEVIDCLMQGMTGWQTTCLLGNHEAMLLDCLETDDRDTWHTWLSNGGEDTCASLGISMLFGGYDPRVLQDALGQERIAWIRSLPLHEIIEPYLFVHAGIVPEIPIDEQKREDLLWIRSRFLDSEIDHGHVVVHGHTPGDEPVVKFNRICVDTGAISNGQLTVAVLDGVEKPMFLRASGRAGKTG